MANSKKLRTKKDVGTDLEAAKKVVEDLQSELDELASKEHVGKRFTVGGDTYTVESVDVPTDTLIVSTTNRLKMSLTQMKDLL